MKHYEILALIRSDIYRSGGGGSTYLKIVY